MRCWPASRARRPTWPRPRPAAVSTRAAPTRWPCACRPCQSCRRPRRSSGRRAICTTVSRDASTAYQETNMQQSDNVVMEVHGLTKWFRVGGGGPFGLGREARYVHAVDDVSFTLEKGRILALVGESGSGKSTMARLLARLYPVTAGTIRLKGQDALARKNRKAVLAYRSDVQMIFQDPFGSLNPVKTVGYHLSRPLAIHKGLRGAACERRMYELLHTVGLVPPEEFVEKYPHQLSGGQRQRVAIACALAVDPEVILADEPTSMLDVSIRMGILNLLRTLRDERNLSYLYITHDLASARYIADETMVLYAGHMMEKAPSKELMRNPRHP